MNRVALYIRVSTDRQAKEGDSLEAQESALTEYAKKNGYIIVDTYIDSGESGQKLKRTNLTRLLEDVKDKKIDLILITKLDRWFRSIMDFYKVLEILTKNKVKWKTIWEEYDTSTALGELWLNFALALAQMEAKRTGERINSVFEHKFKVQKTVCSGQKIYGYDISSEKKLIVNEKEADEIRRLYNYFIDSSSLASTVQWYRENISPKSYDQIKIYLKNTAYIGKYKKFKNKEIVEDFSPRILDDKTFYKAQDIFCKNIKKYAHNGSQLRKEPFIFQGLLKCKSCGRRMKAFYSRGRHYYLCPNFYLKQGCTERTTISEKRMDKFITENIQSEITEHIKASVREASKPKKDNTSELKVRLEKLIDLYICGIIDKDDYEKKYKKIKSEIDAQSIEKEEPERDYTELKNILKQDVVTIYTSLNNADKRQLLMSFVDYITIEKEKKPDIKFR